jgi:rubredoxin
MPCPGSICKIYFVCSAVYDGVEPPCSSDAKVATPSASDNTQSRAICPSCGSTRVFRCGKETIMCIGCNHVF